MKILTAAVSILALAATPVLAQGNGNGGGNGGGNGNGNRGGPPAQAERGNQGSGGGNAARGNRGGGNAERGNPGNRGNADAGRSNRGAGNAQAGNRSNSGAPAQAGNRGNGGGNANAGNGNRNAGNGNRGERGPSAANRGNGNNGNRNSRDGGLLDRIFYRETGLINGCPPGLAAKRNGCLPPGQARQHDRAYRYGNYAPNWWGLPYGSGNYFYEDGFLLQYDGNRVLGYIPLLGGALAIGNPWPRDYGHNRVPDYHSRYYGLGRNYRYADNVVYRLDPETAAIASVAALLTGDEFVVGQAPPRGYDVYNVPYSYRDRYRDGPDAYYRYNDGYVYQIDPETRLVAAAIELLI